MFLKGVLIIYILLSIFITLREARKTSLRFAIKRAFNNLKTIFVTPFAAYFIIGGIYLLPGIIEWTNEQLLRYPSSSNGYFVLSWAPYTAIITIIYFTYKIVTYGLKPWFGYSEKEQTWIYESKVKTQKQLNKIRKFLHLCKRENKLGGLS